MARRRRVSLYCGAHFARHVAPSFAPRSEPLLLRRAIMHGIPNFSGDARRAGCCPYLQFFKGGRLAYTTTWAGAKDDLAADGVGVGEGVLGGVGRSGPAAGPVGEPRDCSSDGAGVGVGGAGAGGRASSTSCLSFFV